MKSGLHPAIHKRILTAPHAHHISRPRSNSLNIYAAPNAVVAIQAPPPRPRETKNHHILNPSPLGLPPDAVDILLPMSIPYPGKPLSFLWDACGGVYGGGVTKSSKLRTRKKKLECGYRLDVGAYGIPKRGCGQRSFGTYAYQAGSDPMNLAVQVGEDSYFVRQDAIGVADGVGGWAARHASHAPNSKANTPTPSALFARRLMHYTSAELELESSLKAEIEGVEAEQDEKQREDGDLELEGYLEELEEGIDVLSMLERAYEKTVMAHSPSREGSSTAMVAVLDDARTSEEGKEETQRDHLRLQVAQVGDCMGMVVRGEEIVWRSEEMWWGWNTPVQLGMPPESSSSSSLSPPPSATTTLNHRQPSLPSHLTSPAPSQQKSSSKQPETEPVDKLTPRTLARLSSVPVRADDILILASDGLSDNLWDEDVVDEVKRCKGGFSMFSQSSSLRDSLSSSWKERETKKPDGVEMKETQEVQEEMTELKRRAMAGMLSEALCSRARGVSERRGDGRYRGIPRPSGAVGQERQEMKVAAEETTRQEEEETPFARRAREVGRAFSGGKRDDISVLVAIIAPVPRKGRPESHPSKAIKKR